MTLAWRRSSITSGGSDEGGPPKSRASGYTPARATSPASAIPLVSRRRKTWGVARRPRIQPLLRLHLLHGLLDAGQHPLDLLLETVVTSPTGKRRWTQQVEPWPQTPGQYLLRPRSRSRRSPPRCGCHQSGHRARRVPHRPARQRPPPPLGERADQPKVTPLVSSASSRERVGVARILSRNVGLCSATHNSGVAGHPSPAAQLKG